MQLKQILNQATIKLKKSNIKSAVLDAELLLNAVLKKDKAFLYSHPEFELSPLQENLFKKYISRRIKHEPIAYLLGHKEFFGLDFKVNKHILIPRPETELLVEKALALIKSNKNIKYITEIGTGSGCLIISIIKNLPTGKKSFLGVATDVSNQALKIAQHNAQRHQVNNKIKFIPGDLLKPLPHQDGVKMLKNLDNSLLVANLPYLPVKDKKHLQPEICFEPPSALWAGADGLKYIKLLLKQVGNLSIPPHYLLLEIDPRQKNKLIIELKKLKFKNYTFIKDLAQKNRILLIKT